MDTKWSFAKINSAKISNLRALYYRVSVHTSTSTWINGTPVWSPIHHVLLFWQCFILARVYVSQISAFRVFFSVFRGFVWGIWSRTRKNPFNTLPMSTKTRVSILAPFTLVLLELCCLHMCLWHPWRLHLKVACIHGKWTQNGHSRK